MSSKSTLQKREYVGKNGKLYTQHRLNIPSWVISTLGWNEESNIEFSTNKGKLVIKKIKSSS